MAPWVRSEEDLRRLAASLVQGRALALDTESDSLHHHKEKVCLVQIASDRGEAWLIDPLAVRDLSPLAPLFADPRVRKVLHGADYDVVTLKRDFGFSFAGLFDTMIAARFLGLPAIGLQALARSELGVDLSKDSQKDDWSRRPLSPRQEEYALADVQHLLELHGRLEDRLRALGRLSWVEEECDAVAELPAARRGVELDAHLRIKGARRLAPRSLAVLRELVAWREELAASSDVPAFRLLAGETLLALAEQPPRSLEELAKTRGVLPRLRSHAAKMLEAVGRALALPEAELPSLAPAQRPVVLDVTRRGIEALRGWRTREAERRELDVSVILPQRLLEKVAEASPRDTNQLAAIEGIRRWRVAEFGAEMLGALNGVK